MRILIGFGALGLAILAIFLLRDGFYVGASVETIQRPDGQAFVHKCRYLLFSGIYEVIDPKTAFYSAEQASGLSCPARLL